MLNTMCKLGAIACMKDVSKAVRTDNNSLALRLFSHMLFVIKVLLALCVMRLFQLCSRADGMSFLHNMIKNIWTGMTFLLKLPFYFMGALGWGGVCTARFFS